MNLIGPLPRLRIYTATDQYCRVAMETLTGQFRKGESVEQLEQTIAARIGSKWAIAMPLARVGIYFAVKALIDPGRKVIMSPYTIADVVNMVICAGGMPVFADIHRETCNIDASEIERLIDSETGAVIVTHFYGLACDIERITKICKDRGIPLIEDAAQAFGVRVNGRAAGTFGDAGIYSFGMYKNVNSFFGGMVVTDNDEVRARISEEISRLPYQRLDHFLKKVVEALTTDLVTFPPAFRLFFFWLFRYAFLHDVDAINRRMRIDIDPTLKTEMPAEYLCRMTPLQARLILGQLDQVEANTRRRIAVAKTYSQGLAGIPEITLPPMRTDFSHMYWYFPIQFERRHELVGYAMRHGRDIAESYHRNCADLPCFSKSFRDCPRARAVADSLIYLPTYPGYTDREIAKTVRVIRDFFGR